MLEAAFDCAHAPIAYLDTQLRFLRVNQAYAAADERVPADFVGRGHFELYPNEENERIFRGVLESGDPHVSFAKPFSYAHAPKRGTTFWDWTLVPVKGVNGRVQGLLLTLLDVTARVRGETMLRAQRDLGLALGMARSVEEALTQVLATACSFEGVEAGGVYTVAPRTGALELVAHHGLSEAFVSSTSRYAPSGPQARLALKGEPIFGSYDRVAPELDPVRSAEGLRALALIPIKHDAEVVAVLNLASRTADELPRDGRVALEAIASQIGSLIARLRSDAERRALEEQLGQTQKIESLGVLAGGIAHDFNNLLLGILANADIVRSELPADSPLRPMLDDLKLASLRAADLARQMLAYAGRSALAVEAVDVGVMLHEMRVLLAAAISKQAHVRYELTSDLPAVEADATQLRQVAMNLIVNASEALGEGGGTIVVRTGLRHCERAELNDTVLADPLPEGAYVFIEVEDNGEGMSVDVKRRAFDPFFSTKFAGRGLGLAAVLGIIRRHRGAVRLHSTPGQGTRFTVLLPASSLPVAAPKVAVVRREEPMAGTVLVVDDEEVVRRIVGRVLAHAGLRVLSAADGTEALARVQSNDSIDLVVLDLTMPQMSGVEVHRRLATLRPELPVVLMSGYDTHDVLREHEELKDTPLLQKPFDVAKLLALVQSILVGSKVR